MLGNIGVKIPKKTWRKWAKETKGMNMLEFLKWHGMKIKSKNKSQ